MAAAKGKRDMEETKWAEASWSPWEGLQGSSADHLQFTLTRPSSLPGGPGSEGDGRIRLRHKCDSSQGYSSNT